MDNKRTFKVFTVFLTLMLIISLLAGCSSKKAATTQEAQPKDRTITDQAGRKVTIPTKIDRVYYTSPIGQIMVYTLAPEKMVGWTMQLSANEKKYILPQYADLPYLGGQQMNAKLNTEEIIKAKPDVIISAGPDPVGDATVTSSADKLQQQLNIPVVVVDGDLKATDKAYEFLGDILGVKDRAKQLEAYCDQAMAEVTAAVKSIPADKRVNVYYAEGPTGLSTDPKGSAHVELLELLNINNVAQVAVKGGSGMSSVSLEQVLQWNPDVILSWGDDRGGAYSKILSSPNWKNISAVKNKKVYEVPNYPFNWFDRPPSVNRFIGLKWLVGTLYPDYYKVDMAKEVKTFYQLFYHVSISDADARDLLKNAGGAQ